MKQLAPEYEERQEFWKPAHSAPMKVTPSRSSEQGCCHCGGNLLVGALFCHTCGADSHSVLERSPWRRFPSWRDLVAARDALGHGTASFAALVLGSIFMVAAMLTGIIFAAATALDWQAVQLWRIQWLLAAIASFLAGILLRRTKN